MTRKYDIKLVSEIKSKQFISVNQNGLETLNKPVPDDDRKNILDPRVLEIAKKKKEVHKNITFSSKYSLKAQRVRPDKVNYDLTETPVITDEEVIPVNNDHFIGVFINYVATPKKDRPALVFIHGGGFTAGDYSIYANAMKFIAEQSGAVVVFPEYRLAPENPFPAGIEDAWATVEWIYQNADELGIDQNKIVVVGDSAGGNLALGCEIKDEQNIIKEIILLYPSVDSTPLDQLKSYSWSYDMYPVIEEHKEYALNRIDRIKSGTSALDTYYLQGRTDYKDPLVSAVYYENLKKFPKTVLISAEYDFLKVQTDYFASLLIKNNVDVTNIHYLGCDHGFLDNIGIEPQAEEVCLHISEEVKNLAKKTD